MISDEGVIVLARFVLYAALGIAFGLSLFASTMPRTDAAVSEMRLRHRHWIGTLAMVGLVASAIGILAVSKAMAGDDSYREAFGHALTMISSGLPVGVSWVVRSVALVVCIVLARSDRSGSMIGLQVATGIALASLALTGHGVMHDGGEGLLHLGADIAHLWAAGAWVGALVSFLMLAVKESVTPDHLGLLAKTTKAFARTGTVLVAVLVATGLVNIAEIVGMTPVAWFAVVNTLYGQLLLVKLTLFASMLVLAGANRWRLSPRLAELNGRGNLPEAAKLLRMSLAIEATLAMLVLASVAWIGTLSPIGG